MILQIWRSLILNKRDTEIIESLKRFRVLDRDQLIQLHFQNLKQSIVTCNRVMKRLRDRKLVEADTSVIPYNYFPVPSTVKKDSTKIPHFKAIADTYIEACKLGKVSRFEVEVKLGEKGMIEPDMFMVWNKVPFFVEVQRTTYSKRTMNKKLEMYYDYYTSGKWKDITNVFPVILIISDIAYNIQKPPLKVFEVPDLKTFVNQIKKK